MTFGTWLRAQRRARELTLKQAGKQLGFSSSYLSDLERGARDPGHTVLRQLFYGWGVEPALTALRAGYAPHASYISQVSDETLMAAWQTFLAVLDEEATT